MVSVRFTLGDAQRAADEWGANCGPGAIAAVCGMTLDELRPHLGDFEKKGYTNPTLMFDILARLPIRWKTKTPLCWPALGLVRVQWEGPWTLPGVPIKARRLRLGGCGGEAHTHWIGVSGRWVFDINAMCVGGWIPFEEWSEQLVPWLLKECEPKANGDWHATHSIEIALTDAQMTAR